ncbi:MAG: bifunctional 5,10-methylenetetrahydrofolate dehydrogenase/5,10-methenyltetrahydrofolate cyclohydrolase [Mycoplasmatales bacterium]|nr:bifunctional 5,10-methylenetetrahydrofolate dehydrogenase/5,10-methenyltetrahydrofolate cyclohydrolase [Mycoplasmatales bacterium]
MKILNGKIIADKITEKLKEEIKRLDNQPILTIVQVGNNLNSNKYIKFKLLKAEYLGVKGIHKKFPEDISEEELINQIEVLVNKSDGIIVQLPLPINLNKQKILNKIPHNKDIDGLSDGNKLIIPATPRGIMTLMNEYKISLINKEVAVVGQSNLVGKPIADLCEKSGAKKVNRFDINSGIKGTETSDILIVAAGQANLIKKENIKPGVIIIDVGISTLSNNKILGDVDRISVGKLPSAINPIIGGVGPMTVISLFQNLVETINKN